ncbi:hypothetical protein [Pelagibius sp. Alg239-R121]|uniref:hypothetical protein n=1 Tax=Pelagibius sp. Alg239-R121 TaxID=2993448 RepID=UPI0024A6B1F7|nr:hypothetical protein [Pelagibius sp. Alg239-R121]
MSLKIAGKSRLIAVSLSGFLIFSTNGDALAAGPPPNPPEVQKASDVVRTGKERLAGKATDEQRVNDCKVAPEARSAKKRPIECDSDARHR